MFGFYEVYVDELCLVFFLYIIDLVWDIVVMLKYYVINFGVEDQCWYFVIGFKDSLYVIVDDYFNVVVEDFIFFDGFDYSGRFVLIDFSGYIWFYCNGIQLNEVEVFKKDIENLFYEMENFDIVYQFFQFVDMDQLLG